MAMKPRAMKKKMAPTDKSKKGMARGGMTDKKKGMARGGMAKKKK
jgi:hypothetical protein